MLAPKFSKLALILLACLLAAGCAKKQVPADLAAPVSPVTQEINSEKSPLGQTAPTEPPATVALTAAEHLSRIHFPFDSSELTADARQTLQKNARWMKDNSDIVVTIEGHTDETGSDLYNLALGERRAQATQKYLLNLGIAPSRVRILSFGEEKPLSQGGDENARALNRRAEFL